MEKTAEDFGARAGFDEDTVSNIAMAVREAAVNAVLHGNAYSPTKQITVSFETTSDSMIVRVADQGHGLDPNSLPDPLAPDSWMRYTFASCIRALNSHSSNTERRPNRLHKPKGDTNMSMKVATRQVDGITILDLSGRITLGEGSVVLRDAVHDVLAKGSKHILLNLGDITYIDSSGIGELVSAFTSVRNAGGELKLLNLTKKVHDLLQITKLYTVFDIKDDEASAIAAFA